MDIAKRKVKMKWRELVEEAKAFGYTIEKDEIWSENSGLHFTKKGTFFYWSIDDNPTFALNREYYQMYQIMLALK